MHSILYRNGVVHSTTHPFAEALLVADGQVAWLGAEDAVHQVIDGADEVVDLDGALVTPAFVDAHTHVAVTGLDPVAVHDLSGQQLLDRLAGAPGPAVVGLEWSGDQMPTRSELARACGSRNVLLVSPDLSRGWDGTASLTGPEVTTALAAIASQGDAVNKGLRRAAAAGVVAVHEYSRADLSSRADLADLIAQTEDPRSGVPLVVGYRAELCETVDDARQVLADIPGLTGLGGDLAVDGSFLTRQAAMRSSYADAPGRGEVILGAEQVANHVTAATRAGTQAVLGAHGDRALDELIIGLRVAADVEGPGAIAALGHRIDGAWVTDAPNLAALVLLGVRASVNPWLATAIRESVGRRLGPLRAEALLPLADYADAGVPWAIGSGAYPGPVDPWSQIQAALEHPDLSQQVSARAAFRAHTRGGWRLAGLDDGVTGEIRLGAPAHLAIWQVAELGVQGLARRAAWSTDPRAGTPVLPLLGDGYPSPVCLSTIRAGHVIENGHF